MFNIKYLYILLFIFLHFNANAQSGSGFSAAYIEDFGVRLTWPESFEAETDYFVLERSSDAIRYVFLARIERGTNSSGKPYKYTDFQHNIGKNYYRLKRFSSLNGEVSQSVAFAEAYELNNRLIIFPNPSETGRFEIVAYNTAFEKVSFRIVNAVGIEVARQLNLAVSTDWHFTLELFDLPDGIYWLHYQSDKRIQQDIYKIVILRKN